MVNGLKTISLNEITNITTGFINSYSYIKFSLVISLIYNITVPLIQNQSLVIQQTQKVSLSQCNSFQIATLTVTSVGLPLEKSYIVRLNTGSSKKRDTSAECSNSQSEFLEICPYTNQLTQCNKDGLTIFLNQYINQSVKFSSLIFKLINFMKF